MDLLHPCLSHTRAACSRQLLHLVPSVRVVQEDHVLVVRWSAAGHAVPHLAGQGRWQAPALQQVGQRQVVVGALQRAGSGAVLEEDHLVGVVA